MFTQSFPAPAPAPAPSSSPGLHSTLPTSPTSPTSRTSRLRGLNYLRTYTQNHLLNREPSTASSSSSSAPHAASAAPAGASSSGDSNASAVHSADSSRSVLPSSSSAAVLTGSPSASDAIARSDTYPLRQTQSAAAGTTSTVTASAIDPHLCLVPVVSHPLTGASTSAQSPVGDDRSMPRPSSPRNQTGIPSAPASAAVSSLQAAYRSDLPSSASVSTLPTTSSSATNSLATNALLTSAANAAVMTRSRSATEPAVSSANMENLPSIRFSTFYDPRATRPSLRFVPMSRTLPTGQEVIRVGRYSERDSQPSANPNVPSAAHVGFKSKVVSRRHCEFWYESNRWYIKDVKSSSGTFLNHIRLSQPGTESKPFPVNDGDIVQLGIDFKGGEEMIFRCVKMRVELNRGWQNKLNAFNVTTHMRLRNMIMPKTTEVGGATQSSQDCSICLNSIAPCQCLFVAPCSHTWHYKCIRALLESPQYPSFICPNCRAAVDLEADVEDPPEEWENMDLEELEGSGADDSTASHVKPRPVGDKKAGESSKSSAAGASRPSAAAGPSKMAEVTVQVDAVMEDAPALAQHQGESERLHRQPPRDESEAHVSHATSHPMPIPSSGSASRLASVGTSSNAANAPSSATRHARTPSPEEHHVAPHGPEGPITPRNDAGPWVFDGSGIRIGSGRASTDSRRGEMHSLDTAAAEVAGQFTN